MNGMKEIFVLCETGVKQKKQSASDNEKQNGPPNVSGKIRDE